MNISNDFFGLSNKTWATLLLAVLVVRAPFLFYFGFSVDAYTNAHRLPPYDFLAGQGRPGSYLLFWLLKGTGLYGPIPQYAAVLLALPLLSVAAVVLWSTIFSADDRNTPAIAMGALVFLAHPYNTEILTFRDAAPIYAISSCLGVVGYYLGVVRGRLVTATLLIAVALSIYQTFINFLVIAWLLTFLLSNIGPSQLNGALRPDLQKIQLRGFIVVATSMLTYLLCIKILNLITHTPSDGRAALLAVSDAPVRLHEVLPVIRQFFHGDLIAGAGISSVITVLLWISGFAISLADGRHRTRFVVVPVVFTLSCLAGIGVILLSRDFWAAPRVLVGFALLPAFGAICCLCYLRRRGVLYVALGVLLVSYTSIGATVAADQVRVNQRDRVIAAALEARIPLAPGQHVAIVRGPEAWYGIGTQRKELNMSAYWPSWSKAAALSEFYGYPVQPANAAEQSEAEGFCKDAPLWPAMGSTKVLDDGLAIVCMGRPES